MLIALTAGTARADLTASYDGNLTMGKAGAATLAGALSQASAALTGTFAVDAPAAALAGIYYVNGQARGGKVSLLGSNSAGTQFKWKGKRKGQTVLRGKARLAGPGGRARGMLVLTRRVVQPPPNPPETCDSSYFTGQVMGRVLQPICSNCHSAGGSAQATAFRVTASDPIATQESVDAQIDRQAPSESRLLRKPQNLLPHGGGVQIQPGSEQAQILERWAQAVAAGTQCTGDPGTPMVAMAPGELLVRASMDLRGARPSLADLDRIEADPDTYAGLVDGYLHSAAFLEQVKDLYDDALLVRREDFSDESRDETWAIYAEALELIAYIVGTDRPFSEMGTADYTVANALLQRDPNRMPFPMDPVVGTAWQPTHYTDGRPHAGLLSTSAFYQVWDTNNTNKNRRRANRVSIMFHCYNFLDTPVDVTRDVDNNDPNAVLNAVTTRPDCKACHDRLDPLASFLFPMDNAQALEGNGDGTDFYNGDPERWRRANRRPPSVYGVPGTDIRDMGRLLVAHEKFAECQTKRAFKLLFLRDPKTTQELTTAADVAQRWAAEDGYNYRALVRRWMLSDAYRGRPVDHNAEWVRRASPERLERLVEDLTGFVWTREPDDDQDDTDPESDPPRTAPVPLISTEEDGFKIILGGINGVSVAGRSYSLNATVAMVQRKLAALAADHVVRTDLAVPDGQRVLLAGVTGAESPTGDEAALRAHVVRLVRRLYGERVATDAVEVDNWVQLYRALYNDATQGGTGGNQVPGTAGERAWRGMLTAMLRSPRILLY